MNSSSGSGVIEAKNGSALLSRMRSFAELIDTDLVEDELVRDLIERERLIPVTIGIDRSLRPKVIDSCGLTCSFCHNEGTPVAAAFDKKTLLPLPIYKGGRVSVFEGSNGVDFIPGMMKPGEDFKKALATMMVLTGCNELHLTGGEPTLHRDLPELIREAIEIGYRVKMTSNGENGRHHIKECAVAGLEKINFSIFGTTPEELAEVQHRKYANTKLAKVKLDALYSSIGEAIDNGIAVDANIVMSEYGHAERVARVIEKFGNRVSVRILNNLDMKDESALAIYRFLAELGATPVELSVEAGTSNSRVKYVLPDGTEIYFKQIRRTTLPDTCGSCSLNNDEDCAEGYYGTRLYVDTDGEYKVGVCLQRMDLTRSLDDFRNGPLPNEIQSLKYSEYQELRKYYRERIK